MPEFDATDLAVTDDDERRIAERAIAALWLAMTRDGVAPGEGQHFLQDRLRQPGQVVADLHQGKRPGDFRSGNPQPVRQLEMPQRLHLLLEVIFGNAHQPFAQFSRQFRRQRRAVQTTGVEQLVKQQREACNLLGDPRAGCAELEQALQRPGIFSQQDQVGRTPGDRFHQRQYTFEHQIRIVLLDGLRQQPWNEGIQTLAAETLHGAYLAGVAQRGEPLTGALAITETGLGQLAAGKLLVPVLLPQRQPFAADQRLALGILVLIRVGDDLAEMPVDAPAPVQQLLMEGRPTVEAEHERHPRTVHLVVRQHLRLTVGDRLQRMLGIAQEFIAFAQFGHCRGRQITLPLQGGQHTEQRTLLQAEIAPSVDQLKGLGDEFDLANATGAQLDVRSHALAPHFLLDQLLHGAQRLDGGEVQVTPVDEGSQHLQQLFSGLLVAADDPRLDHGVALPVAPLILVVLLQRIKAVDQRPGRAVRTQTHVDAEGEAVDGDDVQCLDQPLAKADEEFLIVQRALGADGLAALRIAEDQVDVGGQVQFMCAQLAHAENHHVLRIAAAPAGGHAELLAMAGVEPVIGQIDAGIGQIGEVATGLGQGRLAGQIAPDDAHLLAATETP